MADGPTWEALHAYLMMAIIQIFQSRERTPALLPPFEIKVTGAGDEPITSASMTWELWKRAELRVAEVEDNELEYKQGLILGTFEKLFPEPPEPFHAQYPITLMAGSEENNWKVEITPKLLVKQ